jgi:hypothetical protein
MCFSSSAFAGGHMALRSFGVKVSSGLFPFKKNAIWRRGARVRSLITCLKDMTSPKAIVVLMK